MKVKQGARYIHSASEPYNEEREMSNERIDVWIEHYGMYKFQSHCSGQARGKDLLEAISEINSKPVYPIHTIHPEEYKKVSRVVVLVEESIKYELH